MRYTTIAVLAAVALSVASAITSADARQAKRGWTVGVLRTSSGDVYGPHYGFPTYPSFWFGPTTGVYPVDPHLCLVARGFPSRGNWYIGNYWEGSWYYRQWQWALEDVC